VTVWDLQIVRDKKKLGTTVISKIFCGYRRQSVVVGEMTIYIPIRMHVADGNSAGADEKASPIRGAARMRPKRPWPPPEKT